MPINFPSYKNLIDRTRSDVRNELPNSDPTIFGSFLRAMSDSLASRAYDIVLLIRQALDQFFPQTSSGLYLERWAGYEDLTRLDATTSLGTISVTGTGGVSIPVSTVFTGSNGLKYTSQAGVSITSKSFSITSLTRSGTTVTATATAHPLSSFNSVAISGAVETEYNGTFEVTVIGLNTFQYEIVGTPSTPATGTILGGVDNAIVTVRSDLTGQAQNLTNGASMTLDTPITNVDNTAYVTFDGISGGTDLETDDELRARVLESRANPVANFNKASIEKVVRSVAGVTRVFVQEITPSVGDVTIYFFRDNDVNPIPSAGNINTVKDKILETLPATSDPSNVYVLAPTIKTTDFTFTSITPDTPTMRTSIQNSLLAFFEDKTDFEVNVTQDQYRSAIQETQDTETGEFLTSFVLSSPSGDITVASGEIAGLGVVTF